jgi:hypothetical protein
MGSLMVELPVLIATLTGLLTGAASIYSVRVRPSARLAWWGRRVFVATLLSLGAVGLLAAFLHADGLAPLGLVSGLLTVGMLWETPAAALSEDTSSPTS